MGEAAANKTTTRKREKQPTINGLFIAGQFIDTGWRVALPILVLCYVGIKLDSRYHTAPLYALIGLFLALFISTSLVYLQIKKAFPDFMKKDSK